MFYGSEALQHERENGSAYQFAGVEVTSPEPYFEYGVPMYCEINGEVVEAGLLTSSCWSQHLQKNIAVVSLRTECASNTRFWVDAPGGDGQLSCSKVPLPFFATERRDMPLI